MITESIGLMTSNQPPLHASINADKGLLQLLLDQPEPCDSAANQTFPGQVMRTRN
ncbi:MAG: hypothetical protein V7629_04080 [Motiliproteus sp.]